MESVSDHVYYQSVTEAVYNYNPDNGSYYDFIAAKGIVMILIIVIIALVFTQFKFLGK